MESTLSVTYENLQAEVGRFLGYSDNVALWSSEQVVHVHRHIQSGIRQFYYPPAVEGVEAGYEWSFIRPVATITTIPKYTTGDVDVVDNVATISGGGVWPAWAYTHGTLVLNGIEYTITDNPDGADLAVTGDNVSVKEDDWYLDRAPRQDLPDDFGRIVGDIHYESGIYSYPIVVVSEHRIAVLHQHDDSKAKPQFATTRFKESDGSDGQRQEIVWWPTPDSAYTLTYRYEVFVDELEAGDYPLGGMKHSELITESCLAIAEQRENDEIGLHTQNFMRLLVTSIAQDRKNGAGFFGAMGLGETVEGDKRRIHLTGDITYKGNTW